MSDVGLCHMDELLPTDEDPGLLSPREAIAFLHVSSTFTPGMCDSQVRPVTEKHMNSCTYVCARAHARVCMCVCKSHGLWPLIVELDAEG